MWSEWRGAAVHGSSSVTIMVLFAFIFKEETKACLFIAPVI